MARPCTVRACVVVALLWLACAEASATLGAMAVRQLQLRQQEQEQIEVDPYYGMPGAQVVLLELLEEPLKDCKVTILINNNDDYATTFAHAIIPPLMEKERVLQVFVLENHQLPTIPRVWDNTRCNVYLLVAKDLTDVITTIDTDNKHWNFGGTYLVATFSGTNTTIIRRFCNTYKMQKTLNSFIVQSFEGRPEVYVFTHLIYSKEKQHKFLLKWQYTVDTPRPLPLLPRPLMPDKVRDLRGQNLTVFAFRYEPSILADRRGDDLYNVGGIEGKMVKALGMSLNFTCRFRHPGPLRWGGVLPNGTTYGMTKLVADDEGDIGVANYFIRLRRFRVLSFSAAYAFDRNCFITAVPKELPRWLAIILPFTMKVWATLGVTLVGLVLLVPILGFMLGPGEVPLYGTVSGGLVVISAAFTRQGITEPKDWTMKWLMGVVMMGAMIITAYYTTNLTAFMTVPSYEPPIKTIAALLKTPMVVGTIADNWRMHFLASSNPEVRELANRYRNLEGYPAHMQEVIDGKMAIFSDIKVLNMLINTLSSVKVRIVEECPYTYNIGALLKRNSPLQNNIDTAILHMRAGGLLERFRVDTFAELRRRDLGKNEDDITDEVEGGAKPLTIQHLQGGFLILMAGLSCSLLTFLVELCTGRGKKKDQKPSSEASDGQDTLDAVVDVEAIQ